MVSLRRQRQGRLLAADFLDRQVEKLKNFVKKHKNDPPPRRPRGNHIRLFSDCAGLGTEFLALMFLGLGPFIAIAGGSELDDDKRTLLRCVHESCGISIDMEDFSKNCLKRDPQDCKPCDVYVAGFPCPTFSSLGSKDGMMDKAKRGLVIFGILRYLACHKPKICVLENVKLCCQLIVLGSLLKSPS